ncbi:nitrous oxide reductase accessory protein NosL [Paenibacillus eucommiae]|uniref:Copper chaperone NosL n=1 Tax=Paenibacillus eucommiae TaxID=1355755 RepID=A0ABS4IPP5_9BACL|nr:nitrous oxide reductase accessory protein NosL [Paenibacillus eucommiae]MBP1989522.1 copper chaperone NosL [Paenibacillus eucommiae]
MKMKQLSLLVFLILITVIIAACGKKEYQPQAINEDTDRCVICNMAIKDDAFATQIITKDGQSLKFDDIGCMNEWKVKNGTDTIGASFVRDYGSRQWLNYEKAYYVYDASYKTPMAYGIISFEEEAAAKAFIDEQGKGKMMTAEELAAHKWEVNRDMMDMGEHESSEGSHESPDSSHNEGKDAEKDHGTKENQS